MKTLTCIVCPIGCRISVDMQDGKYAYSGNRCARGLEFAQAEMTAPMRCLTTTVRTAFPELPALPVKTSGEIPKKMIPGLIQALARIVVYERIGIGEPVAADIPGCGCDVTATSDLLKSMDKEETPCQTRSY